MRLTPNFLLLPSLLLMLCWFSRLVECVPLAKDASECPICIQPITDELSDQVVTTPCGHLFHTACIDEWKKVSSTCPLCRSDDGRQLSPSFSSLNTELDAFVDSLHASLARLVQLKQQRTEIINKLVEYDQLSSRSGLLSESYMKWERETVIATRAHMDIIREQLTMKVFVLQMLFERFFPTFQFPYYGKMLHKVESYRLKTAKWLDRRVILLEQTLPSNPLLRKWFKTQLEFSNWMVRGYYKEHMARSYQLSFGVENGYGLLAEDLLQHNVQLNLRELFSN